MEVFYSKDGKLKFEISEGSIYIKYGRNIYEISDQNDSLKILQNGKEVKFKKDSSQDNSMAIDPYAWDYPTFIKSEDADG